MTRWLLLAVMVAALSAFAPSPAAAHYDDYCGHGRHWHAGGYAEYVGPGGWWIFHTHTVYVRKWPFTSYVTTTTCPPH